MNLSSENAKDIAKYFKGCFVKYPEEAGDKLFYVEKIANDSIRGSHIDEETREQSPYIFWLESETSPEFKAINAEFLLPKKSYFFHEGCAHLLYRLPLRQYRRGICEENTGICKVDANGGFNNRLPDWSLLKSYVEKSSFFGFDMEGKTISYPLSPRMAVCRAGTIFVDKTKIGVFSLKTKTITLKHDMFLPEINAILDVHKQSLTVKVGKVEEEVI